MTQEDKQLLLQDLCARLPYGVKCNGNHYEKEIYDDGEIEEYVINIDGILDAISLTCNSVFLITEKPTSGDFKINEIKPYLRPMSSMTEEERQEYEATCPDWNETLETYDWLNAHHFDYRGLIEKGLALEAPEGMYKK